MTKLPPTDYKLSQRSSEETGRPRFRISDEDARPATSDAVDPNNAPLGSRQPTHVPAYASKSTPAPYSSLYSDYRERRTVEPVIKLGDNASSPNLRSYSFSTHVPDRSALDESAPAKTQTGKKNRL